MRRCRGLQTRQCSQLSDHAKRKPHILRPGRGTDVDRCDETSLAILLPTPARRVIVESHSARVPSLRRRAAPTPTSYRLTPPHLILCAGALRPYPGAVIPYQNSLHHHRNEAWTCAICRSCLSARPPSRSPSAPSPCQAAPGNRCREKPQTYVAEVISGLPGMGWGIFFWHDEEAGLDRLTAHLSNSFVQRQALCMGLCLSRPPVTSGSLCQAASNPAAVRAALLDLPSSAVSPLAGVTATARRTGPARRSNQMTGHLQRVRSVLYLPFHLCGPFAAHACHPLRSATVRAHFALRSSHSFYRQPAVSRTGKHDKPLLSRCLHLTTLEQHRGT